MAKSAGYMMAYRARIRFQKNGDFNPTPEQLAYEAQIRSSDTESGAFFDKKGNKLLEGTGNKDEIVFDTAAINRIILQRVWAGQEINYTHNHPENTIFSPEDIGTMEDMEIHSLRAVLPSGVTYTLTRVQPRTNNTWVLNPATRQMERQFTPTKIEPAYSAEYNRVFLVDYKRIRADSSMSTAQKSQAYAALDVRVAAHMSSWLKQNAMDYGYSFKEDGT